MGIEVKGYFVKESEYQTHQALFQLQDGKTKWVIRSGIIMHGCPNEGKIKEEDHFGWLQAQTRQMLGSDPSLNIDNLKMLSPGPSI